MLVNHFMEKGQALGKGDAIFWKKKVKVENIVNTKKILGKIKYSKNKICLDDLISWEHTDNMTWAKGPNKVDIKLNIGWNNIQGNI